MTTQDTTNHDKCPKCGSDLQFEDQSIVGGPSNYWSCTECDEEQEMFVSGVHPEMMPDSQNHETPYEGWRKKVYQTLYRHTSKTDGGWMTTKELWEKSGKRCSIPTMLRFLHAVHDASGNVLRSSGRHGNEWRTRAYEVLE